MCQPGQEEDHKRIHFKYREINRSDQGPPGYRFKAVRRFSLQPVNAP